MSLVDALESVDIHLETLDGRPISLNLDQPITPQTVHRVEGEGMPIIDSSELSNHLQTLRDMKKGDLFIKFDIHFPKNLSIQKRKAIVEVLNKNREETDDE